MKGRATGLQHSILARLKTIAEARQQPYDQVLVYYGIERFLYRLSQIEECRDFVLKGALLMNTWPGGMMRATRDIDMRSYLPDDEARIRETFQKACNILAEDDGIVFDPDTIVLEPIIERSAYTGFRIRLRGRIARAQINIQVDLGFSDSIWPRPKLADYPVMLDMPAPRLRVYPIESFLSEKLEAIVQLGEINSRMKDFYDLYYVATACLVDGVKLMQAIQKTFKRRGTGIPMTIPAGLSDAFARDRQTQWAAFLRRIGDAGAGVPSLEIVSQKLREFLLPVLRAANLGTEFYMVWQPGTGWTRGLNS